jgi:glutamyl-tRNA synthetase
VAASSEPYIIRFKVERGSIDFHDLIRGDVHFEGELLDDFVLLRSDGHPTYHLSVVVDDIDMAITHVARGDDHLSNTPKHILLFRAFGVEPPIFAHLPLILGSDRKRLSKRTGATSAEEYRDMGIVPQALFNFLTLLGWSPGGDREIFSKSEAAAIFDLSDVNKAPAVFDEEKLMWMNGQYLMRMSPQEIYPHLVPFLPKPAPAYELLALIELHQKRARTLREMAEQMRYYFADDVAVEYEDDAVRKHLKGEELADRLRELHDTLAAIKPFDVVSAEAALRKLAEQHNIGAGKLIHPLRLALTGRAVSPPVFDVAAVLGKERTLRRLSRLIDQVPQLTAP